jgi:putative membrane protein
MRVLCLSLAIEMGWGCGEMESKGEAKSQRSQSLSEKFGSRTRDHLSNERTFLAWIRTTLALIGLGFLLARLGLFLEYSTNGGLPLARAEEGSHVGHEFVINGLAVLLLGVVLAGWSGWLYRRTALQIESDTYEPASGTVLVLTIAVIVGGLIIFGLVIWRLLTTSQIEGLN